MGDPVPADVRIAEREVDEAHKSNALVGLPFSTSAWHLLGVWEDQFLRRTASPKETAALVDNLMYYLRDALLWLRSSCLPGKVIPSACNEDYYQAAKDLLDLAHEYRNFARAFTVASKGYTCLSLDGTRIVSTYDAESELRLGAYDRLIRQISRQEKAPLLDPNETTDWHDAIARSVRVRGERFTFKVNPRIVNTVMGECWTVSRSQFALPDSWRFSRYTIADFRRIFICISALAYMQVLARAEAARNGCVGLGFADCLITISLEDLVRRARRYTGLAEGVVREIVNDLTYGSHGLASPDPALQPLIQLNRDVLTLAPHLMLTSAGERNLTALLNRIPAERPVYMELVSGKETLMRTRMEGALAEELPILRFAHGKVPGSHDLPDIDLAIIDDVRRVCLLCELKWFIEPGEPREGIERSEEISKGVEQCLKLQACFDAGSQDVMDFLGIDSTYLVRSIVISANSIGNASAQHPDVPVINESHLLREIEASGDLSVVAHWLDERGFLPKPNVHYQIVTTLSTIGKWSVEWYSFRLLDIEDFFTL